MKGSKFLVGLLSACILFSSLPVTATESEIRVGVETEGSYSSEEDAETALTGDGDNSKERDEVDSSADDDASVDLSDGGNGKGEAVADESAEDETAGGADDIPLLTGDVEINEENFPDEVFRNYVSKNFDTDRDGLLSGEEIGDVNTIDVYNSGVESLKGIENFVNLNYLDCSLNHLENLDVSNNTALETLYCNNNMLTELNVNNNTALKYLRCIDNNLTELNVKNTIALEELYCGSNNLTNLNVSESPALTKLYCGYEKGGYNNNNILELDLRNNTLLTELSCSGNDLTSLDISANDKLIYLNCWSNKLESLDTSNNTALKHLYCNDNNLTELNVSNNTALEDLLCHNNKLTELNVSNNSILEILDCSNNKLTELNLSNCPKLRELLCGDNELQNLDLSSCIELYWLVCKGNHLTKLDLSENINIFNIICKWNELEELIFPESCNELSYLDCGNNKFTSLDVSRCKELGTLICNGNKIESLNLSQNIRLNALNCSNTGLKELDLSKNTELYVLYCSENALSSLDLSQNKELYRLECNNNNLTSLDLCNQERLEWLKCYGNKRLKSVDMRGNRRTINEIDDYWFKIVVSPVTTICCTEESGVEYYCKLNNIKYSYGEPADIPDIGDSTVSGNSPTVSGNSPTVSGNSPTVSGNDPTVSGNNMSVIYGDIKDAEIMLSNSCIKAKKNNAAQKPVPKKVTLNGRTLKNNKDYVVSYNYIYSDGDSKEVRENVDALTKAGSYEIVLTAKAGGRYIGSQSVPILVAEINKTLMSTVKVTLEKNKYDYKDYIGQEIKPDIKSVKSGKTSLTAGKDYIVSYADNTSSGKGRVILTAVSDSAYAGTKEVTFDIAGIKMSKVKVTGIKTPLVFNGKGNVTQDISKIKLMYNGKDVYGKTVNEELIEGTDYTVSYENNNSAGIAKIVFKGKGFYNGVLKKNFKISKVALDKNMLAADTIVVTHSKAGAKPDVTLTYNDTRLVNGIDYTISYKKNKAVSSSVNKPTLTVKGKGSYSGSIKNIEFSIGKKDISNDAIHVMVPDVAYNKKKTTYITKLKVYDNGALLKVNKDYTIEYANNNISTLPAAGRTEVSVTVTGIGNYSGSRTEKFYVVEKLISGLSAKVNGNHVYDGTPVTLDKSEIVIIDKKNSNHILTSDEFEILDYAENTHVGTAKVEVKGLGKYGGTKIIKFKIVKKK